MPGRPSGFRGPSCLRARSGGPAWAAAEGASGPIAFNDSGDPGIVVYSILESKGDGVLDDPVIGKVSIGQ